uniref:Uncharacterized protein LOC104248698 n=1 Tax=Nicotiana sylvestris TaxID=4096 RepID=A0A1U7YGR4_NICSY|nr:PREDICTED: uncharacterized protein LOC104248698 [Nicotiana sylvestris]
MIEELKKLISRVQGVEGGKGIEGLNYEDLCIQPDVELPEVYKLPKFEMFNGIGDLKVHLRIYCDKLVWVGKDERIRMKLFMRSLTGDALSRYITQNPKKLNFMKKATETFREYATRWRSEVAKVRPAMEEEQMNKFFVQAQDPQYYESLMVIENHKFSNIIKLGERIEEGTKSEMVTNFEALQATNKALQSGNISKEKEVGVVMSPIEVEVVVPTLFEVEVIVPSATPTLFEVEVTYALHRDKVRRKGKGKMEETGVAQGMTRTDRVYTPEHLRGISKEAAPKQPIIETGPDDLWRMEQAREYFVVDHLKKTPA